MSNHNFNFNLKKNDISNEQENKLLCAFLKKVIEDINSNNLTDSNKKILHNFVLGYNNLNYNEEEEINFVDEEDEEDEGDEEKFIYDIDNNYKDIMKYYILGWYISQNL